MNTAEEEKSAMIDEPRRLTDELYAHLRNHRADLITDTHLEALRIESQRLVDHPIDWRPF